ncbi:MAG: cytidylyltransferase domain-containing protein [Bacilli bacterium]
MNVCVIQARNGSSRLPGKVLMSLPFNNNKAVLEHVVNRVNKAKTIDKIIVATTNKSGDDTIEELCKKLNVECFRGDEDNVLSRFYYAVDKYSPNNVIRITADCPCVDYEILDEIVGYHLSEGNDYTSNAFVRTFPHGLDTEVFKYECLVEAFNNSDKDFEKEHVTPYIYSTNKDNYKLGNYENSHGDYHNLRITLDNKEDYMLLDIIFSKIGEEFLLKDIIDFYENNTAYFNINSEINQKVFFEDNMEEVKYSQGLLSKLDLNYSANILKEFYDKGINRGK